VFLGHVADCSKLAGLQHKSFSVSQAVLHTWQCTGYQRKTEGIVGCLQRLDSGCHHPGR